jgi:hypothetical protein
MRVTLEPHRKFYCFAAEQDGNTDVRAQHMVQYQGHIIRTLSVPLLSNALSTHNDGTW